MGLFDRQNREYAKAVKQSSEVEEIQEIEMELIYFDNSQEIISLSYNLEQLQQQVSTSFGTGSSMNFMAANPPFSINPRWVKKVTYKVKGGVRM